MSIEYRETYLFGLIKTKSNEVFPGNEKILFKSRIGTMPRLAFRTSIIVETPDRVTLRYQGIYTDTFVDERYSKQEINKANMHNAPSLKDLFLGRRRKYYWKP